MNILPSAEIKPMLQRVIKREIRKKYKKLAESLKDPAIIISPDKNRTFHEVIH